MKINSVSRYMLLKRVIAARQLNAFAGMKEVMQDFNQLYQDDMKELEFNDRWSHTFTEITSSLDEPTKVRTSKALTHEQLKTKSIVNKLLTDYIPLASEGNLSFLSDPIFEKVLNEIPQNTDGLISSAIKRNFQDYARHSTTLASFRKADEELSLCAYKDKEGKTHIDSKAIKAYHDFMREKPGVLKNFDTYISAHTSTMIGFWSYRAYSESAKKIDAIDGIPSHESKFASVTPETFDATISGYYKPKTHEKNIQKLEDSYADKDTFFNRTIDNIYNATYTTLNRASTRSKMAFFSAVLVAGGVVAGFNMQKAAEFEKYGIEQGQKNGTLQISPQTVARLNSIESELTALRNSDSFPTTEQLKNIADKLDGSMDEILSELVSKAYTEKYPDRKVQSVETSFNQNREPGEQNRIEIQYLDEENNIQTVVVTNFDTKDFLTTIFKGIGREYAQTIDGSFDAEKYFDLDGFKSDLNGTTNPNNSFTERADATTHVLNQLQTILDLQKGIAGKEMVFDDFFGFFPTLSIEQPEVEPEPTSTKTTQTTSPQKDGSESTENSKDHDDR